MSDIMRKLLLLLEDEKTINEISNELNLTHYELYNYLTILKNKGFDFYQKYLYDGNVFYSLKKTLDETENGNKIIYTKPSDKEFKCVLISDLQLGNRKEKPEYIDMVFDYCAKEGINIILCAGDFLDGILIGSGKKYITNGYEQIEYAIKRYPFDKNILTFTVLGNHDLSILTKTGQDFSKILSNYRQDIIVTGYGTGIINVKNDTIYLRHSIPLKTKQLPVNKALIIEGHSHRMGIKTANKNLCVVSVPTLSNLMIGEYLPGFIKMTLSYVNGVFSKGLFEQFVTNRKRIIPSNYNKLGLEIGKNINQKEIKYEYVKK